MLTVCLPGVAARDEIGALPATVRVLVWDGHGDAPEGIADTEFLVGAYMGAPLAGAVLAAMPRLRVVQLLSAGVERWQDLLPPGVLLCNGRGVHGRSTAELAVAGILALVRRLPFFLQEQAAGRWSHETTGDLDGKQVLAIGAGDIARRVAAALAVFGARVDFVGRTAREDVHALDELPDLLPRADVVVLAVPDTGRTRRLVDAAFLAALSDGAVLANVARGSVVDTDALLAEVRTGRLSAFLDVTDPEPLPPGHPLWRAPNVIVTPHVGGGTHGWERRGYRLAREQIERFVAGAALVNVVGPAS